MNIVRTRRQKLEADPNLEPKAVAMKLLPTVVTLLSLLIAFDATQAQEATDSYEAELARWSQDRQTWWRRPDGYLALVGLHWLGPTPQSIAGIGQAHLEGQDVVLDLEEGVTVDGKPVRQARVTPEMPRGTPDFHKGTSHFFVIRHGKKIGLRVKDPNSATLRGFSGVPCFPVDRKWRLVGRFEADPASIPVPSVVEEITDEVSPGYAVIDWEGQTYKLRLMGEPTDESYFLVFSDATAGKTSYSGCRFLDVAKSPDGTLVLDFNKAENPPCSMTPYATCPLPPKGNILPFEIPAGERMPEKGGAHH